MTTLDLHSADCLITTPRHQSDIAASENRRILLNIRLRRSKSRATLYGPLTVRQFWAKSDEKYLPDVNLLMRSKRGFETWAQRHCLIGLLDGFVRHASLNF